MTLLKAMSSAPARAPRARRRHAAAGQPGRRDRGRSRRALGARPRRAQVEMQEHAVRRGQAAGPRGAHHRCRPHGVRVRLSARMLHPINWSLALPYYAAALAFGYLLGSIPFGLDPDAARRHAGHPLDRLRQYRRHQRAAHRPQGLAAATLIGDALKGTARGARHRIGFVRPGPGDPRRRSAPFSATCFRSGSASRAAKASPPISASCWRWRGRRRSRSA